MKHLPHNLGFIAMALCCLLLAACHADDMQQSITFGDAYVTDSVYYSQARMKAYNFVYPSTDPFGQTVMLSATITVGDEVSRQNKALGMVLYNHFTVYRADECPTRGDLDVQKSLVNSHLITVSPDYYGFGNTEDKHQAYCIASVNARSSIDALIAARGLLANMGYRWDNKLFNIGYSQGAQTAIGVTRQLAENGDIDITATFAGAGPYDIPATYRAFLTDSIAGMPSTVVSVLLAFNEFANLGIPYSDMFIEPLLSHIDEWIFSKQYTRAQIDNMIGSLMVNDYITPTLIDLNSPQSQRLLAAMDAENLCHGWTPRSNEYIYLFHNTADITVPAVNSEHLYTFLTSHGATNVNVDIDNYGTLPSLPGHEFGALTFITRVTSQICSILGIEPWM